MLGSVFSSEYCKPRGVGRNRRTRVVSCCYCSQVLLSEGHHGASRPGMGGSPVMSSLFLAGLVTLRVGASRSRGECFFKRGRERERERERDVHEEVHGENVTWELQRQARRSRAPFEWSTNISRIYGPRSKSLGKRVHRRTSVRGQPCTPPPFDDPEARQERVPIPRSQRIRAAMQARGPALRGPARPPLPPILLRILYRILYYKVFIKCDLFQVLYSLILF